MARKQGSSVRYPRSLPAECIRPTKMLGARRDYRSPGCLIKRLSRRVTATRPSEREPQGKSYPAYVLWLFGDRPQRQYRGYVAETAYRAVGVVTL